MTWNDFLSRVASRKFWALIAGFIGSIMVALNTGSNQVTQVVAIITAFGSIAVYILAETSVDKASIYDTTMGYLTIEMLDDTENYDTPINLDMTWKDFLEKIASRKFWALIAGFIGSIMIALNVGNNQISQIVAIITAFGSIAVYILAEASVDKASLEARADQLLLLQPLDTIADEEDIENFPQ